MDIRVKYNIGDEVETLLWDIGFIVEIIIQSERIRYTLRHNIDKYVDVSERQIKRIAKTKKE